MKLRSMLRAAGMCAAVWAASAILFVFLGVWSPGLDVIAGANAMTMMFLVCAGTAVAVEAADRMNR